MIKIFIKYVHFCVGQNNGLIFVHALFVYYISTVVLWQQAVQSVVLKPEENQHFH